MTLHPPPTISAGWTFYPVSPPSRPSISAWLLCVFSSISRHLSPWCDSFSFIFSCPNCHPNDVTMSPHTLHPPCTLSPTSLLPLLSISCWSLCVLIIFGHKTNSLPISLIFDGSLYGAKNRETNRVKCKPGNGCLAWVLWYTQHHMLVAPLAYPWR